MVAEKKRIAAAMARMSPEGRAKTAAINTWLEMVEERKRLAAACARMSPEGRAKTAAVNAWKEMVEEKNLEHGRVT